MNKLKWDIPQINIESFGDWSGMGQQLKMLPITLKTSAEWGQRKAAEKLVKIVVGHLDNQDLGWTPLKRPELSGDSRILVDYGTYRNNIKTWQKSNTRFIGVKKNVINSRGEYVWMIAALHEHKSLHGGPYRALWEPSIKEVGGAEGVRDIIGEVIINKLSKV